MGSLTEQLFEAGLISKSTKDQTLQAEEHEKRSQTGHELAKLTTKTKRPVHWDRLESCASIGEFKDIAKKLLTEHPDLITDVIQAGHRFKEVDGGKKLIWLLYQIKDLLPRVKGRNRGRFLKRALRRTGANLELPR